MATIADKPSSMRAVPWTLIAGLLLVAVCELLLFVDVHGRGGAIIGRDAIEQVARFVAIHMTPLCWVGYLLVADGLLTLLARRRGEAAISSILARPNRFIVAWLTSVSVWCYFDWANFAFLDAWRYHGLPANVVDRWLGYVLAFAAISPAMFLAAQLYQHLGLKRLRTRGLRIGPTAQIIVLLIGVAFAVFPHVIRSPIGTLTLWLSVLLVLDPVNHWLAVPSIIGDWRAGRWGRTIALVAGGATCGLLWELWNYWAIAKWTYHLPFLGSLEQYRYFEMPLLGFAGFLPFALECWAALNTIIWVLDRLHLRVAESLPDEWTVL